MIPVGEAVGDMMTDRLGPVMVFIVFGTFNILITLIPLLVRDVREME